MTSQKDGVEELKNEALYIEVHRLVTEVLESSSPQAAGALESLLVEGGLSARECYTAYMQETDSLRRAGLAASQLLPQFEPNTRPSQETFLLSLVRNSRTRAVAALFSVAASLAFLAILSRPIEQVADSTGVESPSIEIIDADSVATLVRATRVQWHPSDAVTPELSRLAPGKRLRIESGQIELLFDSGVELVIAGRADVVIGSSMRVVGTLGKFSARVSERGRGFTIETPATHVIDLGTEFGVEIAPSGSTKVAVFKGAVDLDFSSVNTPDSKHSKDGTERSLERLGVGEAVLIDSSGERSRVVTIGSDDFPKPGLGRPAQARQPALFASIRDNIRSPDGKKFYRIVRGGLYDDVDAYVDRDHEWNGLDRHGLPQILRGADYIMPFNDDKFTPSFELTLELSAPCTLYVLFDNNMAAPDWLLKDFKDTGVDIGLDQATGRYSGGSAIATGGGMSIDDTFSVWSRSVKKAESLRLGGVDAPADIEAGWNMYGIAATRFLEPRAKLQ